MRALATESRPRSCIGKELNLTESKIVVRLVARRFELSAAYEELDAEVDRTMRMKMARVKGLMGRDRESVSDGKGGTQCVHALSGEGTGVYLAGIPGTSIPRRDLDVT